MNILLQFTVENFRSIAERKTISMKPRSIKDDPQTSVRPYHFVEYLCSAAIYGANSSGKSNIIRAMACMCDIVINSVKINEGDALEYDPFILYASSSMRPTSFEATFFIDAVCYRYGFSYIEKHICEEWLYHVISQKKEQPLFIRNTDGIGIDEKLFPEGKDLEAKTNDNRLFISVVGQLNGNISKAIISFFREGINVVSGLQSEDYRMFTRLFLNKKQPGSDEMMAFFSKVRLGFQDITTTVQEFDPEKLPSDIPQELKEQMRKALSGKKQISVSTSHGVYDDKGNQVETKKIDFDYMESEGTKKLFDISGPIFDTLRNGAVLVIDELDAKMHPLISQEIVCLFNDPQRNPYGAQLIFTTHDTSLLSSHTLRRDQVWFTEKDAQERTDLYNMMQIVLPDGSKPRGDGNMERNYIRGRYGAIPYMQ